MTAKVRVGVSDQAAFDDFLMKDSSMAPHFNPESQRLRVLGQQEAATYEGIAMTALLPQYFNLENMPC